jgi:hypothetical protein
MEKDVFEYSDEPEKELGSKPQQSTRPVRIMHSMPIIMEDMQNGHDLFEEDGIIFSSNQSAENNHERL